MAKAPLDPAIARRLPPGQQLTNKWPVLTYGRTPRFDPKRWSFRCFGLVEHEVSWTWEEFLTLPRVTLTSEVAVGGMLGALGHKVIASKSREITEKFAQALQSELRAGTP